jgi:TRAP-type C4-dicarboxylate transport system permease large subunit
MIIYATATSGISIAGLFLAGVIPGIMMGLGMMVITYFIARKRGYPIRGDRLTARELGRRPL